MICGAALILIFKALFGGDIGFAVDLGNSADTEVLIGVNKDFETVRLIPQNVVRAPAHYYAGLFQGKIGNNSALRFPKIILVIESERTVGQKRQKSARIVFLRFFDVPLVKATFGGDFFNELVVVTGNSRFFRDLLPIVRPPLPNSRLTVIILFFIDYFLPPIKFPHSGP